jgi:tetratricopeptide (TPR) repeat protein
MILSQSVIIIISFFLVSLIEFGDADAQEQDIGALMDKGVALQNSGKNEEAIGYYDKALAIDPNHVLELANKGSALGDLEKYNESIVVL